MSSFQTQQTAWSGDIFGLGDDCSDDGVLHFHDERDCRPANHEHSCSPGRFLTGIFSQSLCSHVKTCCSHIMNACHMITIVTLRGNQWSHDMHH